MARINIEDSLFKDARWWDLIIKLGCQYKGLGYLTKAWILAQEHWIEYGYVPQKAWPEDLDVLIEIEFAEKVEGGVYIKGSKKAFAWLEQRVEAGRKGGLKKRKQNDKGTDEENIQRNGARVILNKAVKSGKINKPNNCDTCGQGGVVIEGHHSDYSKPLEVDWVCKTCHTNIHRALSFDSAKRPLDSAKAPTLPLTPSLKKEELNTKVFNGEIISPPVSNSLQKKDTENKKELNNKIHNCVAQYAQAFKTRYKHSPTITKRDLGLIKNILATISEGRLLKLIQVYLQMNDAWFEKKYHDIPTLSQNLNKISVAVQSGVDPDNDFSWLYENKSKLPEEAS